MASTHGTAGLWGLQEGNFEKFPGELNSVGYLKSQCLGDLKIVIINFF